MSVETFPTGEGFPVIEAARELVAQAWDIARGGLHLVAGRLGLGQDADSVPDMGSMYSGDDAPAPAPPNQEPLPKRDRDANRDKIKDAEPGAKPSDPAK